MIKITTCAPDTCGCKYSYSWDTDQNEDVRVHTLHQVIRKCPAHATLTDQEIWDEVHNGENRRKNLIRKAIVKNADNRLQHLVRWLGEGVDQYPDLADGVSYQWSWSGTGKNRVLNVSLVGANLTNLQKLLLQSMADSQFGAGKVVIV